MYFQEVIEAARNHKYMESKGKNNNLIKRTNARIKKSSEVFTPNTLAMEMCDDFDNDNGNWAGHMRDTACGDGQILSEVLLRKIAYFGKQDGIDYWSNPKRYKVRPAHYAAACQTIWGVDINKDNAEACRKRLRMGIEKFKVGGYIKTEKYLTYKTGWRALESRIRFGDWLCIIKKLNKYWKSEVGKKKRVALEKSKEKVKI